MISSLSECLIRLCTRAGNGSNRLLNSGFGYPNKSVTINLAPANVRKEGAGFDLPMALGILGATGAVGPSDDYLFVGELSLDGSIRPVRGASSIAVAAPRQALRNLIVPYASHLRGRLQGRQWRRRNGVHRRSHSTGIRLFVYDHVPAELRN